MVDTCAIGRSVLSVDITIGITVPQGSTLHPGTSRETAYTRQERISKRRFHDNYESEWHRESTSAHSDSSLTSR